MYCWLLEVRKKEGGQILMNLMSYSANTAKFGLKNYWHLITHSPETQVRQTTISGRNRRNHLHSLPISHSLSQKRRGRHGNLPSSLETGDTAAFSPILDIASKYKFPARIIAEKMIKLSLMLMPFYTHTMFFFFF